VSELAASGFVRDSRYPLNEHNLPRSGALTTGRTPVIYEGVFRAL
jgi:hypothetical protein